MSSTAQAFENLTLNITQEIHVRAPLELTFAALLERLQLQERIQLGGIDFGRQALAGRGRVLALCVGRGHTYRLPLTPSKV